MRLLGWSRESPLVIVICCVLIACLAAGAGGGGVAEEKPERLSRPLSPVEAKTHFPEELESALAQLVDAWRMGRLELFAGTAPLPLLDQEKVRVVVETDAQSVHQVEKVALDLGGAVDLVHGKLVQAVVPVQELVRLARADGVRLVRLPFTVRRLAESEGVALTNADRWGAHGYQGSDLKVGVLDSSFRGYEDLLGTHLPENVITWWAPSVGGPGYSRHGTACAEIIHDMAPEADFFLANVGTDGEWAVAVDWFIGHEVDVISCSLGWLHTGPGDGTGSINDKVADAHAAGITWASAAGNQARNHWSGEWTDPQGDGWLAFSGNDDTNSIYAYSGERITIGLRWDDPWGASDNDYDLYLYDDRMNRVAWSTNPQTGKQRPREFIDYVAPRSGTYHIRIHKHDADGEASLSLMTFDHELQYQVAAGSLLEPADSPHAITVGAVPWYSPDSLAPYSSHGPTADGRVKPDLVAPDGVSTMSYGAQNFYGTSAAATHVAGAAALVKGRTAGLSPDEVLSYLETHAVGLGTPGKSNRYGSGRLWLPDLEVRISASAGDNGTIEPAGSVSVDYGASQSFIVVPDEGYAVEDVFVDGASVLAEVVIEDGVGTYTFDSVTDEHTIHAVFAPAFRRTFQPGWHLLAVPVVPVDNSPENVFRSVVDSGQGLVLFEWGPGGSYRVPAEIDPARGYWLFLSEAVTIEASGGLPGGAYTVDLTEAGWHQVSTPKWPVAWASLEFQNQELTLGIGEAVAAGWIEPYAFFYSYEQGEYVPVELPETSAAMEAWRGYWLKTQKPELTMVIDLGAAVQPIQARSMAPRTPPE